MKRERRSCDLDMDSVPIEASQRTKQYVLDQLKERESEFQSCDNSDTQAKSAPVSNHNVSPPPLKPEATPFYPHQNNAAPHHLVFQQPYINTHEVIHKPFNMQSGDVRLPHIQSMLLLHITLDSKIMTHSLLLHAMSYRHTPMAVAHT